MDPVRTRPVVDRTLGERRHGQKKFFLIGIEIQFRSSCVSNIMEDDEATDELFIAMQPSLVLWAHA